MKINILFLVGLALMMAGCTLPQRRAEAPAIITAAQLQEPAWIRNGDALLFEGAQWLPTDEVENILDAEVYQAGTYRDVAFYLEQSDVRPFDRVYTRFGKNRYRVFEL